MDNTGSNLGNNRFNSTSFIEENIFDKFDRSSPSFNDSSPPSYFEAIGLNHNHINLNTDGNQANYTESINPVRFSSFQQQPRVHNMFKNNSLTLNSNNKEFQLAPVSFNLNQNEMQCQNHMRNSLNIPTVYQTNYNNNLNYNKPSETFMVWSIFTTFYCVFIGLPALVLSIKVHHYNKQGNYEKAFSRSKISRNLNIAGLFFGFIYLGIGLLACLLPRG